MTNFSETQRFLDVFRKEHATTLKIMKAFPPDEGAFQPHPKSGSALRLMWTFVMEQQMIVAALDGTMRMPPSFEPPPETVGEVIAIYEEGAQKVEKALADAPESRLSETVQFFTGPKAMGDVPVREILWLFLMDSIHHRGQLSVYVRMKDGKVPSIYGPSLDEPWM
jgi:uncharacterized damage-inducible protein DinB